MRGQRAHAGAHLEDDVVGAQFGRVDEDLEEVEVDKEILSMPRMRLKTGLAEALHEVGGGLTRRRHGSRSSQEIETS